MIKVNQHRKGNGNSQKESKDYSLLMLKEFATNSRTEGTGSDLRMFFGYWSSTRICLSLGSRQSSTMNPLSGRMCSARGGN